LESSPSSDVAVNNIILRQAINSIFTTRPCEIVHVSEPYRKRLKPLMMTPRQNKQNVRGSIVMEVEEIVRYEPPQSPMRTT
jgi:hypothetical protein